MPNRLSRTNSSRVTASAVGESSSSSRRACVWKRLTCHNIARYRGRASADGRANRPDNPLAPAYSSPQPSQQTLIDISASWVATPSSAKSRSRFG